jgi:hypothetical protein
MNQVEVRLDFILKRILEVKKNNWNGVFRKPILW